VWCSVSAHFSTKNVWVKCIVRIKTQNASLVRTGYLSNENYRIHLIGTSLAGSESQTGSHTIIYSVLRFAFQCLITNGYFLSKLQERSKIIGIKLDGKQKMDIAWLTVLAKSICPPSVLWYRKLKHCALYFGKILHFVQKYFLIGNVLR